MFLPEYFQENDSLIFYLDITFLSRDRKFEKFNLLLFQSEPVKAEAPYKPPSEPREPGRIIIMRLMLSIKPIILI